MSTEMSTDHSTSHPVTEATEAEAAAVDPAELERLAVRLAETAGRLVVDERPDRLGVAATKSSDTDVVTVMDQRSEELLRREIAAARPQDGVLGEEGDTTDGTSGITWVVDPIDGTVNYLYEIPAYAVSVAACTGDPTTPGQWQVLAGAVHHPVLRETWHARVGGGAFRATSDGVEHRLTVSARAELADSLVGTGFGYEADKRARQAQVLSGLLPDVRDIRRTGAASLDLCAVAAGRLDAYYESGLHPWDLAAGWVIVTEAGGHVTGGPGLPPSRELVVAGPSHLVDTLEQRVS